MGMDMKQMEDVTQVIIKTGSKHIVIDDPSVMTVTVQGQKIFQIAGGGLREETVDQEPNIVQEDIVLVAEQAGSSMEDARKALIEAKGDLARAILSLKQNKT